ncbi:MAG: TolC family protein [Candidatus Omnitrophica bacterium]|nr:TolC family protein [Candidatus Omnitrophota bacterium]
MRQNRFKHAVNVLYLSTLLVCFVLTFQSCMTTLVRETGPELEELLDADVNTIDNISLNALSQHEPITIDEGAREQKAELLSRNRSGKVVLLDLAGIRAAALVNNLDLKVDMMSPSIAKELWLEERAKFEAVFFGGIQYTYSHTPTASQLVGAQSSMTRYEAGFRQPLPTGGEIAISQPGGRFDTDNQWSTLNPSFETDLRFSFSQQLLRGAGLKTNTHSLRVARLQQKITDAQIKLQAIRVLAEADRAYWRVYGASQAVQVSQQQYKIALRQLSEAKLRVKSKAAAQIEIVRAESGVAARLENIILSLTNLRLYERNLKRIMNRADLPIDATTAIVPMTEPSPLGLKLNPRELAHFAVGNRMEMLELELRLAVDESSIDFARNGKLPYLLLDYSYNINGLGSSYGKAYDQIRNADFADWSIGLRGEIPLGNKAANARLRQALLTKAQRLATREQRQQAIEQEVYDAIDLLDQNWQRILASRQDVLFAARTYEAERKQFELGVRTSTDVLYAAERLALAQLREIQALVDHQIAQVDIAYATGTLLGEARVEWEAAEG